MTSCYSIRALKKWPNWQIDDTFMVNHMMESGDTICCLNWPIDFERLSCFGDLTGLILEWQVATESLGTHGYVCTIHTICTH